MSPYPTTQCPPSGAQLASLSQSSCLFPHPFWARTPLIPEQTPASPGMGWEGGGSPELGTSFFFKAKTLIRTCLILEGFRDKVGGQEGWEMEVPAEPPGASRR